MTTSAADAITISRLTWVAMVGSLRKRGQGRRESGAFLLGRSDEDARQVKAIAYYDDLDPSCLDEGFIKFRATGYSALWDLCERQKLKVIADVHTHPGSSVRQSSIDRAYPMIPTIGHVGMILPHYANTTPWSLKKIGLYLFLGGGKWKSFVPDDSDAPLRLSLW